MDTIVWKMLWYQLATPVVLLLAGHRVTTTMAAVEVLPWWQLAPLAAAAGAIGSLPIVLFTRRQNGEWIEELTALHPSLAWLHRTCRRNMFLLQTLISISILPDPVGPAIAGYERYPLWRFCLAQFIGRTLHNIPLVLSGVFLAQFPWFHYLHDLVQHPITTAFGILIVIMVAAMAIIRWYGNLAIGWLACEED